METNDEWVASGGGDRRLFFPHAAAGLGSPLRGFLGRCPVSHKKAN